MDAGLVRGGADGVARLFRHLGQGQAPGLQPFNADAYGFRTLLQFAPDGPVADHGWNPEIRIKFGGKGQQRCITIDFNGWNPNNQWGGGWVYQSGVSANNVKFSARVGGLLTTGVNQYDRGLAIVALGMSASRSQVRAWGAICSLANRLATS